ncbi:hypothetical protein A0H81_07148 [Grifola frondosa]|uniref:Uncharacterized protein n=1 Tax=Grifola frondosa TaxID=5627 RepID=A0A1C7M7Y4_GRIFR|nr:hypothetical protein A0H81_07148 [Grifola frondosa]
MTETPKHRCVSSTSELDRDGRTGGQDYAGAARDQLNYLLQDVPRTTDGAISHRVEQVQLWSDFVYMVPPFLAYYGVLLQTSHLSWRPILRSSSTVNISLIPAPGGCGSISCLVIIQTMVIGRPVNLFLCPCYLDLPSYPRKWLGGGRMLRVLGTIQHSQYSGKMKSEMKDLAAWVAEIQTGMYAHLHRAAREHGVSPRATHGHVTYLPLAELSRIALSTLVRPLTRHLPLPRRCRRHRRPILPPRGPLRPLPLLLPLPQQQHPPQSTHANSVLAHFTGDMWLTPVVNPESFGSEGSESPEAQAFVIEMYAAWRDWVALGSPTTMPLGGCARLRGPACLRRRLLAGLVFGKSVQIL